MLLACEHQELFCATNECGCSLALRLSSVLAICAELSAVRAGFFGSTFARKVPEREDDVRVGAGLHGARGAFGPEFHVRVNVL